VNTITLNVPIKNTREDRPGTLAWLVANAGHIELGTTKDGRDGAWLKGKDGKTITVLCLRNWGAHYDNGEPVDADPTDPEGPITIAANQSWEVDAEFDLTTRRAFSAAAYKLIRQLAEEAVKAMDADKDCDDDTDCLDVVTVRVKDAEAAKLAAINTEDPTVVPILRDRLKEVM